MIGCDLDGTDLRPEKDVLLQCSFDAESDEELQEYIDALKEAETQVVDVKSMLGSRCLVAIRGGKVRSLKWNLCRERGVDFTMIISE